MSLKSVLTYRLNQWRVSTVWLLLPALWLAFVHVLFSFVERDFADSVTKSIATIVRSELTTSNFDFLSRSILELKNLGSVRCVKVNLTYPSQLLILNNEDEECLDAEKWWRVDGVVSKADIIAENGSKYSVHFRTSNSVYFDIALWSFRFFGLLIIILLNRLFAYRERMQVAAIRQEQEQSELLRRLAAQLAHDVRSPLSALRLIASTLPGNLLRQKTLLDRIVDRIDGLSDSVLQEFRKSQKMILQWSLTDAINEVVEENRYVSEAKGIRLLAENLTAADISVMTKVNFQRILSNSISNSIDALENSRGEIQISSSVDSQLIRVTVRDSGHGFDNTILETLNSTTEEVTTKASSSTKGYALGSSHARKVIRGSGGKITYRNVLGGAEVEIEIPIH